MAPYATIVGNSVAAISMVALAHTYSHVFSTASASARAIVDPKNAGR
jgi:hypothetical protein